MYEMEVNTIAVMRRRKDSWLNATQILKVAGIEKGKRTKVLEKEILIGEHEKVQGGYGKYQGTWIKFERGVEFCRQYGVEELLRPLLTYDMGQDGGIAGRGGIDTPTKEQAMAAQRKRLYNAGPEGRSGSQSGTFFKNISQTASTAVAAINKARYDSPGPRVRNGASGRPASFSRQSSQQHLGSQENAFPGGSQQSMQSFVSENSFTMNGQDSAYATQSGQHYTNDGRNGDFEEPPRKRMRPSPSIADSQSQQQPLYDDYGLSMREATPTEPNDSFVYNGHPDLQQDEGYPMSLPPLLTPTSVQANNKKSLLMSLFTDPHRTDFSKHEAFLTLSLQELEMPVDNTAHTALSWAATLARVPLLKTFISKGASIFRVNRGGETALMKACVVTNNLDMGTFPDILELLGPTIELRDSRGRTVLHHIAITSAVKGRSQASKYYLESLLEFVVRQGSAPNSQQSFSNGLPALKSMGIGRFMSEIVNVQDKSGDTALNIAARIGNRSIISQLLEVGADPSISNRSNLCPIDFGIGDPADAQSRVASGFRDAEKTLSKEARESSGEIINCMSPTSLFISISLTFPAISTLLTETENEFTAEMTAKQAKIDSIHIKLRESSALLGQERSRLEALRATTKARDERALKTANLRRALDDERARLAQLQAQYGPLASTGEMRLGDADKGLALPADALPPPAHILRARVAAYAANNELLRESVRALKVKSSELAGKYRRIISVCTGVPEKDVDEHLGGLIRAMESEPADLELGRVREFLSRVDAV